MKNEQSEIERIESYLNGSLDPKAKSDFEAEMAQNPDLKAQVNLHDSIHEMVIDAAILDLKQKLKNGNFKKYENGNRNWILSSMMIFLGIIICTGILYVFQSTKKESKNIIKSKPFGKISKTEINKNLLPLPRPIKPNNLTKRIITKDTFEVPLKINENSQFSITEIESKPLNQIEFKPTSIPKTVEVKKQPNAETSFKNSIPLLSQKDSSIQNKPRDYAFQPSLGEVWKYPIESHELADMKIFDSQGQMIYSTKIGNGFDHEWNGVNQNGSPVHSGNYLFIITLDNEKVIQGYVTVVK